jgi:ribosomal protein S18 acetylase RimI-like enzyme
MSSTFKKDMIETINALPFDSFRQRYFNQEKWEIAGSGEHTVVLLNVNDMAPVEVEECFHLVEKTSRHDYEPSSFGWHPKRKLREMKEEEMRYMRVYSRDGQSRELLGFLSFMLTHDSTPLMPVLYIYEVHLTEALRGRGLGKHLLQAAEDVATKVGVEKIMLTCFKSNENAYNFYKHFGYVVDECSPEDRKTRNKTVKADYVIMSKRVDEQLVN